VPLSEFVHSGDYVGVDDDTANVNSASGYEIGR